MSAYRLTSRQGHGLEVQSSGMTVVGYVLPNSEKLSAKKQLEFMEWFVQTNLMNRLTSYASVKDVPYNVLNRTSFVYFAIDYTGGEKHYREMHEKRVGEIAQLKKDFKSKQDDDTDESRDHLRNVVSGTVVGFQYYWNEKFSKVVITLHLIYRNNKYTMILVDTGTDNLTRTQVKQMVKDNGIYIALPENKQFKLVLEPALDVLSY